MGHDLPTNCQNCGAKFIAAAVRSTEIRRYIAEAVLEGAYVSTTANVPCRSCSAVIYSVTSHRVELPPVEILDDDEDAMWDSLPS